MENKLKYENFDGLLIHKNFGLSHEISASVNFDLSEINRGNILNINVKMPGNAINSPHELPYENYEIQGKINGLDISMKNLFLREWKEVFLYSYGMKFVTDSIIMGNNEKTDKIVFFLPNLLIGYDEMSISDGIINYSEFKVNLNNKDYVFKITGDQKFNNGKDILNLEAQTDFTVQVSVYIENELLDYSETMKVIDDFINLIGFAYGSVKPWVMLRGYLEGQMVYQEIKDISYTDASKSIPAIPYFFSKELSGFITDILPKFYYLNENYKVEFKKIFSEISKINEKNDFVKDYRTLELILSFFNIPHLSFKESNNETDNINPNNISFKVATKDIPYSEFRLNAFMKRAKEIYRSSYQEGDYKMLMQTLSIIHKFILKYFEYHGKYWDWSNITPIIREDEF